MVRPEAEKPLSTGVGSVPFKDAAEAVAHVFRAYDVPFFPQLPALTPKLGAVAPMLREVLTPALVASIQRQDRHGVRQDLAAAKERQAAVAVVKAEPAFALFAAAAEQAAAPLLKLQHAGPHTIAALLALAVPGLDSESLLPLAWDYAEALSRAWAESMRERAASRLLLIWDDGLLAADASLSEQQRFADLQAGLAAQGTALGLHSCAPSDLKALTDAFPRAVLSLDLHVTDAFTAEARAAVLRHQDGGGAFIFGVFDTRRQTLDVASGRALASRCRELAVPLMFSGGCGTGLHDTAYELVLAAALKLP